MSEPNPWVEEATDIIRRDEPIPAPELHKVRTAIARHLARAYEYGFAQGRLAEIDAAKAKENERGE